MEMYMTQHVVVTGANRGIGLAFVKQYLAKGFNVTAVVRKASDDLTATSATIIDGIDVASESDVEKLQQQLANKPVDLLINNAGIFHNETLSNIDFENIQRQLEVNAIAPVRVTHALQQQLTKGAKVAMITSRMGSISDNGSGGYIGYRMSKAALNAASKSLAIELANREVNVAILHPGFVQTEMVGYAGDISPEVSASRLIERIDALSLENTGTFWHSNGEELPW